MAQTRLLTFGATGGVPAQTPLGGTDDKMPFVLGPTVDIRILPWLSIESGVLFTRMGRRNSTSAFLYPENSVTIVNNQERAWAMEIPILAKLYLLKERRNWRPFVTAGPTIRRTELRFNYASSIFSGSSLTQLPPPLFQNTKRVDWHADPAAGVGVDFKAGRFHLDPEVRYSYWVGANNLYPVRKNQVNFLLGFRF